MTVILGILAFLLVASLVISAVFYSRQQAIAKRDAQIKKFQQKADELNVLLVTILKIDPKYELAILFHNQILSALQHALALNPQDPQLLERVAGHRALSNNLKKGTRPNEVCTAVDSDDALSAIYFHFVQITKILEMLTNNGKMSRAQCDALSDYIQELKLDLEVNSHILQAERYGQENDLVHYQTHLKQAIESLKKSPLDIENKNERIKELSDRINEAKARKKVVITNDIPENKTQAENNDTSPETEE